MNKKIRYLILGLVLLVALVVGVINEKGIKAEATPLFTTENIYETKIMKSWEIFRKENKISENARIEDFNMVLSDNGVIESVKFKVVEKRGNKFRVLHHQGCVKCPNLKDNENSIWKESAKEWPSYSKMISVKEFFPNLEALGQKKVLTIKDKSQLFLVRSQDYTDKISLPGEYFVLEGDELNPLEQPKNNLFYKGYNLQILENDSINFRSDENTRNIIISDYEVGQ